jgi:hypothetical protein
LQQCGLDNTDPENDADGINEDDTSDLQEPNGHIYLRAPRWSKSQKSSHPTTVGFYPGSWKTVLDRAKNRFAQHVFLNQGFPVHSSDIGIARDILHEEIAKGRAEKLTLDLGKLEVHLREI